MEFTITIRGLDAIASAITLLAQSKQGQAMTSVPASLPTATAPIVTAVIQPPTQSAPAPIQTAPAPILTAPTVIPTAVPTSTNTYSIPQLQQACAPLVDAGRQGELVQLINSFGVQALTNIPLERLGEFATALRGMGAKI